MLTAEARRLSEKAGKPARVGNNEWSPIWENNPYISKGGDGPKTSSSIGRRPYLKGWNATRLFYDENHRPEKGEIYLTDSEKEFGKQYEGSIIVEPHVKATYFGANKAWIWDRWIEVARALPTIQCLPAGKRPLPGSRQLATPTIRHALAILSSAKLLITTDGALHHAAAALQTPCIVLWGQRTNPLVLGYPEHLNLTAGQSEFCGSVAPCEHCRESMLAITAEQVIESARGLLEKGR